MEGNHDVEHDIVIGIDFGTTFSGVSWAYSGQPTDIEVISRWESKLGRNSDKEKTPTEMVYQENKGGVFWGYGIPPNSNQKPLKWFKLLLVDEDDLPQNVRESSQMATARKLAKRFNKDPVEIISCYLRHLWNHAIECIVLSAGKDLVKMCKFHVVITLPAIWSDYAKQRMRRAAENAGLLKERPIGNTTLTFISEPEAAALATMRDHGRRPNINVNDHIVVCDAGGGTVDLITYEIVSKEPFIVREAVQGDGGLCGGVFLDEAFVKLMKKKVTPEAWNNISELEVRKALNNEWENNIKTAFHGQDEDFYFSLPTECQAPGSAKRGIKRKKNLVLTRQDLLSVFDPVVDQTVALVEKQIESVLKKTGRKPKKIILVGGFGRNDYLRIRIAEAVGEAIEILQSSGNRPWSAISRGAVIQGLTQRDLAPGLSVNINSRISRMSYGVDFDSEFDKLLHDEEDRFWNDDEQKWMVHGQMEWFLEKGDDVSNTKPVCHDYYKLFTSPPDKISDTIYCTKAWPAPESLNEDVEELCTITWTKDIDFQSLPHYTNPIGKVFSKLSYSIEMTCSGGSIDFAVIHDGKQVGAKNVTVVFKDEDED
nr:uncharacterized protein CTRU02_07610 [Colletotrichum truncatum]KAF6791270.1 hypothetical protein CTRU02_07610 [Colletotrichum truncatum]